MRCLAVITLLVLALAFVQPVAAQGFKPDYNAGVDAYERKDYATALKHFRPLAKQGDAKAQRSLGAMYRNGQGVTKDYKEAVKWYRKAAIQGNAHAQSWLGDMYYQGQGVLQDFVMACVWHNVAAANGEWEAREYRDQALAKLNASELRLGRKLAKLCFKNPAKCPEYSDD